MHEDSKKFAKNLVDRMFSDSDMFDAIEHNKILQEDFSVIMGFIAGSALLMIGKNFCECVSKDEDKQEEAFKDLMEYSVEKAYKTYLEIKESSKH